ncbi:hypothetical protein [Chondromyces apiculatus]|uniref:Uncharacterized protein n=1 Tax=Chondromyces apiculatus DSM 436 TaxID=1192034 RepID=A0A017SY46_9BACT|nr:hypothetical protein [Chondromyces apiculatus]EYF01888.1 Hypothetical protein CAP_7656 [Chondromyces apiculatus DSM 436]
MISHTIEVPSSAIAGAAVQIDDLGPEKTVYFKGGADQVFLELSPDGSTWYRHPDLTFANTPPPRALKVDATHARAVRATGSGGTISMAVVGVEGGAIQGSPLTFARGPDGSAGATQPAMPIGMVSSPRHVTAVTLLPGGALTANATNFATLTLTAYSSAGTLRGTVATLTTETGSWTSLVPVNMPLGAVVALQQGDSLALSIAKAGTGVVVPLATFTVHLGA